MTEQNKTQPSPETTGDSAVEHGQHPATDEAPEVANTPDDAAEDHREAGEVPGEGDATAALRKARKEAADRRVAAREATEAAEAARTEAEALRNRLSIVQDRWVAEKLFQTGVGIDAFRAAGYTGDAVLNEDGDIDADKFAQAVTDTAERFGRVAHPAGYVPSQGTGNPVPGNETSWQSVLNPQ